MLLFLSGLLSGFTCHMMFCDVTSCVACVFLVFVHVLLCSWVSDIHAIAELCTRALITPVERVPIGNETSGGWRACAMDEWMNG